MARDGIDFDGASRRLLTRARRGVPPRTAMGFVYSPAWQFTQQDRGGRTAEERAFTRSIYHQVMKEDFVPGFSLRLKWGRITFRSGRWGRPVQVRLFRLGDGRRHARRLPERQRWALEGEVAPKQSLPGRRIDQ